MYRLDHASHPDVASEGTGLVVEPGIGVGTLSETQQLNSFQTLALNKDEDSRPTPFMIASRSPAVAVTCSETSVQAVQSLCQLKQQPLLFSHLEHSTSSHSEANGRHSDSGGTCCSCSSGQWNGATLNCASSVCPACGSGCDVSSRVTNQNSDEDIIASFNSLSVSNSGSSSLRLVPSNASSGSHLSCRQQAATYGRPGRYFDDTTVDDLAGYLDEIMFLPKPMSEMAELMYT